MSFLVSNRILTLSSDPYYITGEHQNKHTRGQYTCHSLRGPQDTRMTSIKERDANMDIETSLTTTRPLSFQATRRITYRGPEFIKRLPADQEVKAGEKVTFECVLTGFPKPSVKWYKDDEEITENTYYKFVEDGGTYRLEIGTVWKQDEGSYKCKAENREGVTSTYGFLSVKGESRSRSPSPRRNRDNPRAVSYPPMFPTINENIVAEEKEEEEYKNIPVSPLLSATKETEQKEVELPTERVARKRKKEKNTAHEATDLLPVCKNKNSENDKDAGSVGVCEDLEKDIQAAVLKQYSDMILKSRTLKDPSLTERTSSGTATPWAFTPVPYFALCLPVAVFLALSLDMDLLTFIMLVLFLVVLRVFNVFICSKLF